jgi:hypothetical protein
LHYVLDLWVDAVRPGGMFRPAQDGYLVAVNAGAVIVCRRGFRQGKDRRARPAIHDLAEAASQPADSGDAGLDIAAMPVQSSQMARFALSQRGVPMRGVSMRGTSSGRASSS